MAKDKFIDKTTQSPYHLEIKQLYNEGIKLIQSYAGDLWSDYNEHDPGVTILENLVYAITDLCYKMGFETLDYLVAEDGYIKGENVLYEAHEILSSHPVTIEDYRKFLFDRIDDISNVWIEPVHHYKINGLYKVYLFLHPSKHFSFEIDEAGQKQALNAYENELKKQVIDLWPTIRNTGEDLNNNDIIILKKQEIIIEADLTLRSSGSMEEILAEIILQIDLYMNPELIMYTLNEMTSAGFAYDEIFVGPHLEHGFIKPESLMTKRPIRVTKAEVLAILSSIEGILQIENLKLVKESADGQRKEGDVIAIEDHCIPRFKFEHRITKLVSQKEQLLKRNFDKSKNGSLTLKMRRKSTSEYLPIDYDQVIKTLRRKQALMNRVYSINGDAHSKAVRQTGTYREWSAYYSIQNHFPAIYGINSYGLSTYEPDHRKAQALQLKGFLLIFEQLIANLQSQMGHLKDLYSIDADHLTRTYYAQPLLDSQINEIEKFYNQDGDIDGQLIETTQRVLDKLEDFHPHFDRKSRVLDYMLAIYGERFTQNSLRRFEASGPSGEKSVLINKARMLELVKYFNHNSAKAPSFGQKEYASMSGFELKIRVLLNMELTNEHNQQIENLFDFRGVKVIRKSDKSWKKQNLVKPGIVKRIKQSGNLQKADIYPQKANMKKQINTTFKVSGTFLRLGFFRFNYFIYHGESNKTYYLLLKENEDLWYLIYKDRSLDEVLAVYETCLEMCFTFSVDEDEYTNVDNCLFIDHITLRPRAQSMNEPVADENLSQFYSFNLSAIFPNWGDKFGDEAFRQLAEETVRRNIPAHVLAHMIWLDPYEYDEFHSLYQRFLNATEAESWRVKVVSFLVEKIKPN